jgi:hypothetical protein
VVLIRNSIRVPNQALPHDPQVPIAQTPSSSEGKGEDAERQVQARQKETHASKSNAPSAIGSLQLAAPCWR